ncbi:hypothetical protein [Spartinivicinus poritis]|uniref:Mor transcription activator domain-containing protein n=1 Tax=Spartinivicinus poritis TaxID=2994640 RepID=A0ABT5U916_9GAMM|nr:hypothetical protein [Spartinivicinus sp. A2-2]MDE1461624.1 hypothetical protein [Spartinivicinus sp. A2-2]
MNLLHELAEIIGPEAALKLGQNLGGARLYIPHRMTDEHILVALIGREAAEQLSDYYQGDHIELPTKQQFKQVRNDLIRKEYVTIKSGGGCSRVDWLAAKYGICRRQALNILREEGVEEEVGVEPVQCCIEFS